MYVWANMCIEVLCSVGEVIGDIQQIPRYKFIRIRICKEILFKFEWSKNKG